MELSLSENLIQNGYYVKGSTTSDLKSSLLKAKFIDPYKIQFNPEMINYNVEKLFECYL